MYQTLTIKPVGKSSAPAKFTATYILAPHASQHISLCGAVTHAKKEIRKKYPTVGALNGFTYENTGKNLVIHLEF